MSLRIYNSAEQVAAHLRAELQKGMWGGVMPGILALEAGLSVNRNTIQAALRLLEGEGLLISEGNGRPRRIVPQENFTAPSLRVKILLYEHTDMIWGVMLDLQHRLLGAGYVVELASKTLQELGMDVNRVARFVEKAAADVWIVVAGSRAVLEWFAEQPIPAFAMFGRRRLVAIAGIGPDKIPAIQEVVSRLVGLGHRKIVMLLREEQLKPQPGAIGRAFLEALAAHGIQVGEFNLPEWKNTPEEFLRCLDSLFRVTPPTALIVDDAFLVGVAQHYLARRGILAPQHVSLVCTDYDPTFEWYSPKISHIHWDRRMVVRRIVGWCGNVAHGKEDYRNDSIKVRFVEGGTVGPAWMP